MDLSEDNNWNRICYGDFPFRADLKCFVTSLLLRPRSLRSIFLSETGENAIFPFPTVSGRDFALAKFRALHNDLPLNAASVWLGHL